MFEFLIWFRKIFIKSFVRTELDWQWSALFSYRERNIKKFPTHFSGAPDELEAGLRLLKAFIHLVFIDDELDVDNFRSPEPPIGDPGSVFFIKSSFYNEMTWEKKKKEKVKNHHSSVYFHNLPIQSVIHSQINICKVEDLQNWIKFKMIRDVRWS